MKKSLFIPLLCGLSFVYTACDEYDDTYPKEYHKILSLKQTGEESKILYNTGQDASFDITIMKTGCDPSLTAQAQLTVLSVEIVATCMKYDLWATKASFKKAFIRPPAKAERAPGRLKDSCSSLR